jgi:hypothetical protein
MKITLADGVESTLGDLRGGNSRTDDYTRKTQAVAREREAFSREKAEFERAKAEAEAQLASMAEKLVVQRPAAQVDEIEQHLQTDPVARKLVERIDSINKKVEEANARAAKAEETLQQQQRGYIADQHRRVLATLKQRDPDLNEQDLVRFAQENYIPRLDLAYRLYTEDARLKSEVDKAREEARKEAYDRAKRDLAQPVIPQRRVVTQTLDKDAPQTFDEAAERAAQDPEILNVLSGGSPLG